MYVMTAARGFHLYAGPVLGLWMAGCGSQTIELSSPEDDFSVADMQSCIEGAGAEFVGLMRGPRAPSQYCECVLRGVAERYSAADRSRLAADSVLAIRGLLGLAEQDYTDWISLNIRVRTVCTANVLGEEAGL